MKNAEVVIGKTYQVKVSGKVVPVLIVEKGHKKGWVGRNTITGRDVHIKTGAKLRRESDSIDFPIDKKQLTEKRSKPSSRDKDYRFNSRTMRYWFENPIDEFDDMGYSYTHTRKDAHNWGDTVLIFLDEVFTWACLNTDNGGQFIIDELTPEKIVRGFRTLREVRRKYDDKY